MLNKEWSTAIEGFLVYDRALGKRSTTNSARRQHLQHLARRVTVGPWAVTGDVLIDYLGAQEWAQETRRGRRTSFDRFYRWAIYRGFVHTNPVDAVEKVRMSQGAPRPAPDRAYHEALMRAAPRERIMLRLAAEVGMRRGEVAVAHTRDVMEDLVGRSLVVHGKGGRTRIVPLPDSLGRTLAACPEGYVFPGNDAGHLSPRYVGKLIRDLLPDQWTMHTLRHRFATRLYAHTRDLLGVQGMLGHATPTTTRRYVQWDTAKMRAAVDELAG